MEPAPDIVVWAEQRAVAWAPVDVADALRESLWESGITAVLVSRRPSSPPSCVVGSASMVRERSSFDSPLSFREQALLYVPADLPEPRMPGYADRIADEVLALCSLSRGRALVLTSSYRMLDELAPDSGRASVSGSPAGRRPA